MGRRRGRAGRRSPSIAQGIHGSGTRLYSPQTADLVLSILLSECIGRANRKTVEWFTRRVALNGRALRDVVSDLEKARRVLTNFGTGYFVCTTFEEAEESTRRLESQIANMLSRVDVRRELTAPLPRIQDLLL